MSANDHGLFRQQVIGARRNYDKDGDSCEYAASCLTAALRLWLAEQNALLAKMGHARHVVPTTLTLASPILATVIQDVADHLNCPINEGHTANEYLTHFASQIQRRYSQAYVQPVRDSLESVHDALRRLGIVR